MSITLMAYPMAFLISPENAKNEKIQLASEIEAVNEAVGTENLRFIRVLTNITTSEYSYFKTGMEGYVHNFAGINVEWNSVGKYMVATLSGGFNSKDLQTRGERYFECLDKVAGRNARLIESSEYFYYNYDTSYTDIKEIYKNLKKEKATGIFSTADDEVVAILNGQNIKYYKPEQMEKYLLEVEQKISIVNIGLKGQTQGNNVSFGLTNLKIQTNIKQQELKTFLKAANYSYYEAGAQTPLKSSDAVLNWSVKNGCMVAEFSGSNNAAITKEAETIFRKLNIAAGRDLRYINDIYTTVYTYKTNYMDKGVLLNTLTEHGAQEILETGDEISCKLFGMEMIYYKKDSESSYTLDITQVSDKQECQDLIDDLNEEYGLNIQEITYNKIKERLEHENMRLESETVMDDDSIVLTIEV